ncbi:hypothetical protein QTP88_025925 [Uroleucon formosanum]
MSQDMISILIVAHHVCPPSIALVLRYCLAHLGGSAQARNGGGLSLVLNFLNSTEIVKYNTLLNKYFDL